MFLGIFTLRERKDKRNENCLFNSIAHYKVMITNNSEELTELYKRDYSSLRPLKLDKFIYNLSIINITNIETENFFLEFNDPISNVMNIIECSEPRYKNIYDKINYFSRGSKRYFYINKNSKNMAFKPTKEAISLDHKIFPRFSKEIKHYDLTKHVKFENNNITDDALEQLTLESDELNGYICTDRLFNRLIKSEKRLIINSKYIIFYNLEDAEYIIPIKSISYISSGSIRELTIFKSNNTFDCSIVNVYNVTIGLHENRFEMPMLENSYNNLKKYFLNYTNNKTNKIKL
jgi:hypothetical protein